MKQNKVKLYAKALADILSDPAYAKASAGEEKKITNNFVKLLVKEGLEKKSKDILNLAEEMLLEKQGKSKITFETARKMTVGQKKLFDSFVKNGDLLNEKIDPEIIAGIKIIINNSRQFDASMKSKLQNIF